MPSDIKGLHHTAYRCNDLEETRKFYEDFLGLPLVRPPLGAQVSPQCKLVMCTTPLQRAPA